MSESTVALFKCLADPSRIAILNILARSDSYVELIAARTELSPATVCYHLKKLEAAGLVRCSRTQFYVIYALNREVLDRPLADLLLVGDSTADREQIYRQKVLDSFFSGGRLTVLPAQRKKREIVLEKLADCFEYGRDYPEKEVNRVILDFYDDFCTVRRALIEFGLMERENGIYRRIAKKGVS